MKKNAISYARLYINDNELIYKVKYSRKAKYLRLQINPTSGLEVVIPPKCNLQEAEKFIFKKREWILKHLTTAPLIEGYSYFGNKIELSQKFNLFTENHNITLRNDILLIESPSGSEEKTESLYNIWLKRRAKSYLIERAEVLALKNKLFFNKISIRNQKTRWGSCSTSGNISLNYRLMKYRKEVIDYVIIHELCHLKEMNHSKKFWMHVEKIIPDYKLLKRELKGKL